MNASARQQLHKLTLVDPIAAIAECRACGPATPILLRRSKGYWVCATARRASRGRRSRRTTPAERRRHHLSAKFGLTPERYDELLYRQNGVCAICLKPCSTGRRLAVDHDHETGSVRGLLCNRCNRAIGLLCDDPQLLRQAITYLAFRALT